MSTIRTFVRNIHMCCKILHHTLFVRVKSVRPKQINMSNVLGSKKQLLPIFYDLYPTKYIGKRKEIL